MSDISNMRGATFQIYNAAEPRAVSYFHITSNDATSDIEGRFPARELPDCCLPHNVRAQRN
ncbi:MAG: hypothetical protein AAGD11_15865 [Planctomycetota bacterium]